MSTQRLHFEDRSMTPARAYPTHWWGFGSTASSFAPLSGFSPRHQPRLRSPIPVGGYNGTTFGSSAKAEVRH